MILEVNISHPIYIVNILLKLYTSQQIQDYLNRAKDSFGRRFFNWAILTNGAEWRLYTDRSAAGAYFAFYLIQSGQFCALEDFKTFITLFRASAFEHGPNDMCFLDRVQEQSLRIQADLETNLRKRIFSVLEDMGTAFLNFEENHLTEIDYPALYDNALIFLYRLLFILYAESRDLLPVMSRGPGSNRRYFYEFSLARLVERLRDRSQYTDNAFTNLYEELFRLFNLINGTHPRQNESLGVARYNGGLFNPELHPKLEQWRIGDRALADVLRQLIFSQPPTRPSQRQSQFSTDEAIDYSTLEVRQLGDIYEGLLGAHFVRVDNLLELRNENGENHRHGIFYTPDWVVQFLVRETLNRQIARIEQSPEVRRALDARSEERRRDNSFAMAVLQLNIVDPAMGSGHFLVRATEWLADKIMKHPTTRSMTEQIVAHGQRRTTRKEILSRDKVPVPPGISQEQAEISYWRRRVVEACIYGVDINPMAVELAKLSLWLTCIAADEPLNFLDHHLRHGNALLYALPDELRRAPSLSAQEDESTFEMGDHLHTALAAAIHENMAIEGKASTEMEIVKSKERQWRIAQRQLEPFIKLADLWVGIRDGLPVESINYILAARHLVSPDILENETKRRAKRVLESLANGLADSRHALVPFHWHLEFPDVYYGEDGIPLVGGGFDAVLGNPPYVSTHTSSAERWRQALELRAGYLDDLYVHFVDLGFRILKPHGSFGFIISDTFFTLGSKLRMREMLQSNRIDWLGQCDPFEATVDAAIFVARKEAPVSDAKMLFVQARPLKRADGSRTKPEAALPRLPHAEAIPWVEAETRLRNGTSVAHTTVNELRIHQVPLSLYIESHKRAFFEPRSGTLALFERFNERVKRLVAQWWEKIEDSRAFAANLDEIMAYHRALHPGDVTLVGLIAEGGQGMRTGNNARFLAYLEGTPQAQELHEKAVERSTAWLADQHIAPDFRQFLVQAGGNPRNPTHERAAWESAVHHLRDRFTPQQLGLGRTALFRIAPRALIATDEDCRFAFDQRKTELLRYWQQQGDLNQFWDEIVEVHGKRFTYAAFRSADTISDHEFCRLCQHIQLWVWRQNASYKKGARIPREVLGLRSSEDYVDPADGPRIAAIYNGLSGRGQFLPFRKGDPEGSRWIDNEPLYCEWTKAAVDSLMNNPQARWQGHNFFLKPGVAWSLHANHVPAKCRYQEACVFDASSSRLTPIIPSLSVQAFVALANSDVFSFFLKKFIKHNQDIEINDMRMMPIVIPEPKQHSRLTELAKLCITAKRAEFSNSPPGNKLVVRTREIAEQLRSHAPHYLHPSAQDFLLATSRHCLSILENAVSWEAEKLYGVEGLGPFNEF